ncbi:MAG: hypothetical protein Q7S53_05275 [bacterium]|nr:hypothetical protein [bacterium]
MNNAEQINNPEDSNEKLSTLRESLRQAIDDGDMRRAQELQEEILPHLEAVKEGIGLSPERAKEIMRGDYLGPEAIRKTFGMHLEKEDIPRVPFTEQDLERARVFGQFLILRRDQFVDGTPMKMLGMDNMVSNRRVRVHNMLMDDVPTAGWALVSKEASAHRRDYIEETQDMITHIKKSIFSGIEIPREYQEAIDEFEEKKQEIKDKATSVFLSDASEIAAGLKINKLARQTIADAVYDTCVYFINNDETFLSSKASIRTNSSAAGQIYQLALIGGSFGSSTDKSNHQIAISVERKSCDYGQYYDGMATPGFLFARTR